jgi:hypothetical protein
MPRTNCVAVTNYCESTPLTYLAGAAFSSRLRAESKADLSLEIICIITISSSLKKVYSVNFNLSAREKYSDNFLIDDHTYWSKQDFGKLLARLNYKLKFRDSLLANKSEYSLILAPLDVK